MIKLVNWFVEKCLIICNLIQYSVHLFVQLIIFQVTTYDSFRYGWKSGAEFKRKHMASKVKGQHGIQLLIEIERSLFRKNVFGCICIGTYVRFIVICQFKFDIWKKYRYLAIKLNITFRELSIFWATWRLLIACLGISRPR